MRYIPISGLSDGMVCGKNLYDVNNQLMLRAGNIVRHSYIERIKSLGYQGIYINDEFSADIIIRDVIPDELRMTAVDMIRDICNHSGGQNSDSILVRKKVVQTKVLVNDIIAKLLEQDETLVNMIDLKFHDDYTFLHSVNVAILSLLLGLELALTPDELQELGMAALLHDIGKIFVRSSLLKKAGSLSSFELDEVKQHVRLGYEFLKSSFNTSAKVNLAVLQHHERVDGRGYPNRLSAKSIGVYGQIIGIADVYDALTANRPFRESMGPSKARAYILDQGGCMFDEGLTQVFVKRIAPYPVGTYVRLNSGHAGIVFKNYKDDFDRPVVKLIIDKLGKRIKPMYVDLKNEKQLRSLTIIGTNEHQVVQMIQNCM